MTEIFKKRKGTTNQGTQYEVLNVANIVLNLVHNKNVKNFQLSSNDETYGDFDDIVVDVDTSKGKEVYAVQLKHKQSGVLTVKDLLKGNGDFGIQKYFNSFKSTEHKFQKLILFTNLKCNVKNDEIFHLQDENFCIKFVKANPDDTFEISDRVNSCYKLVINDSPSERSTDYIKFFDCFWIYTNQENAYQLEKSVTKKFQTEFTATETESDLYLKFIKKWCDEDGLKEKLNKIWMQQAIALVILSSRIQPLSFEPINDKIKIFQQAIDNFDITIFKNDSWEKVVKLWGDANMVPCDIKVLNQLRKRFQIFDASIKDIKTVDRNIASKLLWLVGTCPLIVMADETVYKAIELCPNKKFVLLESDSKKLPQYFSSFRRLSDLDEKSDICRKLITTCSCSLQRKNKLSLASLLNQNRQLLESIRTDDLLEMIVGVYNVGGGKESVSEPYIERYLSQNVINSSYLDSFKQDTIVIIDCAKKIEVLKTTQSKLIRIDNMESFTNDYKENDHFSSTIYYSEKICTRPTFVSISNKHKNTNIHQFRITQDGGLKWIRSKGDISDLQKYKTDFLIEETKLFSLRSVESINLIVADPGMGKSELMKSLKNNCPSDLWTVTVSPKEVRLLCKKIETQKNVVQIFDELVLNLINDRDKIFFQNCLKQNNVVYIWDALDEITDNQLKIAVKLIVELSCMERVQWITSRYHLKNFLESELSTVALSLTQFDKQTQKLYIEKRLKINNSNKTTEICEKIRSSFVLVEHKNILGIPLQLFMITELFLRHKEKYLDLLNDKFIVTDLYFHFIEEKIKIYIEQKVGVDYETPWAESTQNDALDNLEKLALKLLISTGTLEKLNVYMEISEPKRKICLATGLVTDFTNHIPRFIHISFAEYLVSVFFARNHHKIKDVLIDVLFESRFLNVRFFFDLLLAQNCPTHIAVLYKNIELLKSCESEVKTSKDDGGRNALHLACAWGQNHPTLKLEFVDGCYVINDDYTFRVTPEVEVNKLLVEYLLNHCNISHADTLFGMKPSSYAQKSGNLLAEIKIIKKEGIDVFKLDKQHVANILYYSTLFGYDEAFDIFQTNIQKKKTHKMLYNLKSMHDLTLLGIACRRGDENIVEFLVENGSEVNLACEDGFTPLHTAALNGYKKMVEFLVSNGSQINRASKKGFTSLFLAAQGNHKKTVEFLVTNGSKVNLANKNGSIPLHTAAQNGHDKIVKFLVVNGSRVNVGDKDGFTPLHAAAQNGHNKIVEFLVAEGSQVNLPNKFGFTPLYMAVLNQKNKIVEFLVANGAQVNLANEDGYTPLHTAARHGHKKIVEFLVSNGSEVNLASKDGVTPLIIAAYNGHKKVVEFLVSNGSQVNLGNKYGSTPLHEAALNGDKETVEFLVANGSQVNLVDEDGFIPLYGAALNGHKESVEFLVVNGSQVNLPGKNGFTPLHAAAVSGHKETVEFLVANGSQVNFANNCGSTPLDIASEHGHTKIVEFLAANGGR